MNHRGSADSTAARAVLCPRPHRCCPRYHRSPLLPTVDAPPLYVVDIPGILGIVHLLSELAC